MKNEKLFDNINNVIFLRYIEAGHDIIQRLDTVINNERHYTVCHGAEYGSCGDCKIKTACIKHIAMTPIVAESDLVKIKEKYPEHFL